MDVRVQSILVSNHTNWELTYRDSQCPKETRLSMTAALIGCIVAWPIFLIGGTVMLTLHSFNYFKTRWNQYKVIKVLTNKKNLEKCAEKRIECCKKQIKDLKSHAIFLMEGCLKKPMELNLPIPQKKEIKDYLSSHLPESYWKDFPWDEFLNKDFFQESNIPDNPDKKTLQHLEKVRIKLNRLFHQEKILSNLKGNERLKAVKRITELSFVKNGFKRQKSKEWVVHAIFWLLPSGMFWDLYFNSPNNERLTYEGKSHFLPQSTKLRKYADFVDAHNQLVRNHDFLVPYIENTII